MSYDTYMQVDTGRERVDVDYAGNYTSNVSVMWLRALDGKLLYELEGLSGELAVPLLVAAVQYFRENMGEMQKLNPSNGWGNAEGALKYLESILKMCEKHPKAFLHFSH